MSSLGALAAAPSRAVALSEATRVLVLRLLNMSATVLPLSRSLSLGNPNFCASFGIWFCLKSFLNVYADVRILSSWGTVRSASDSRCGGLLAAEEAVLLSERARRRDELAMAIYCIYCWCSREESKERTVSVRVVHSPSLPLESTRHHLKIGGIPVLRAGVKGATLR